MAIPKRKFDPKRAIREIVKLTREREKIERREQPLREALKAFMVAAGQTVIDSGKRTALLYDRESWSTDRDLAKALLAAEDFDRVFSRQVVTCLKVE